MNEIDEVNTGLVRRLAPVGSGRHNRWLRGALIAALCFGPVLAVAQTGQYNRLNDVLDRSDIQSSEPFLVMTHPPDRDEDERESRDWHSVNGESNSSKPGRARVLATTSLPNDATFFAPVAAFGGNKAVIVGRTLETTPRSGGALLVRTKGCSLSLYASANVVDSASMSTVSLNDVEPSLRRLAGLAAVPATYPKGCADRARGTPSTGTAILGTLPGGDLLVAVADDQSKLSIARISPTGTLVGQPVLATGIPPTFAVADLNGDGLADIVVPYWTAPDGSKGVAVFLSQASGTYTVPSRVYPYGSAVSANLARVSIEDVDGDGKLDVVAIAGPDIFTGTLMTLRGDGTGGFSAPAEAPRSLTNAIGVPYVIADVDGDGRKDILTANGLFFAGQGNGSFAAPVQRLNVSSSQPVGSLAVGDFNGDGKLDVAVLGSLRGSTGRFVSIFIGKGDGTFSDGPIYSTVAGADELSVTDIDGDGNADVWVGKADSGVYSAGLKTDSLMHFLLGKGDGTFAGAAVLAAPGARGLPTFAVADFNGDGKPDLVSLPVTSGFLSDPSQLRFSAGSATGSFGAAVATANLSFTPTMVGRGDFNGDGKVDIVVAGGKLAVLLGRGDGTFGAEQVVALPAGASGIGNIAVGDVNGDGRSDVVVIANGSGFSTLGAFVYYANADGTLQPPVRVDGGTQLGPLVVADLNGDGRADIALAENGANLFITGTLRVYQGRADGSFAPPLVLNPATYYTALAVGDIDKDGKADLIVGGATAAFQAQVSVLAGKGDGTFAAASVFPLADGVGTSISTLAVADFTFDGNPDLLVGRDGNVTEILIGDGTGRFVIERALAIAAAATYAVAADLNGDTVMDAVVAVGQAGIVPLLRTRQVIPGATTTTLPFTVSASSNAGSVASGESVQTTLTFVPSAGFTDTVALSCSGLPANASCSFSPASIVSGTTSSLLTIQTGTQAMFAAARGETTGPATPMPIPLGAVALATLIATLVSALHLALTRRRGSARAGRAFLAGSGFAWRFGTLAAAGWLAGCGGGGSDAVTTAPPAAVTPSGSYNVVVTATSPSGTQTLTYVLTVR